MFDFWAFAGGWFCGAICAVCVFFAFGAVLAMREERKKLKEK